MRDPVQRFEGDAGQHNMGRTTSFVLVNPPPVADVELPVRPTRALAGFGVEPVDMPDILMAFRALADKVPNLISALADVSSRSERKLEERVAMVARSYDLASASNHVGAAFLKVDLVLGDREILDDFRHALADARIRLGINQVPRIPRAELAKLRKHLVLPYLDLTSWARSLGCHITNDVLADALLVDTSRASADTVRKTIQKHAESAIDPAFIVRLRIEALREARRKKSAR